MTPNDVKKVIETLIMCSDKLSNRQRDKIRTLAHQAPDLSYKQLKLMFRLLIIAGGRPICPACGEPIKNVQDFSMDHIYPRTMGGGSNLANLQPMHKHCNEIKGSQIQAKYFVEYKITTTIKMEFIANHERNKGKKHRNKERLKPWQITINNKSQPR